MESSNHLHPEFLYWWIKATYTSPVLASWSIATRIIASYRASHNGKIICSNGDYYSIIHQRLLLSIVIENFTQYNLQQILKKNIIPNDWSFAKKKTSSRCFSLPENADFADMQHFAVQRICEKGQFANVIFPHEKSASFLIDLSPCNLPTKKGLWNGNSLFSLLSWINANQFHCWVRSNSFFRWHCWCET